VKMAVRPSCRVRWLGATLIIVFLANIPRAAAEDEACMPAARFASFLARLLSYDESLRKRAGKKVVIAALSAQEDGVLPADRAEMQSAIKTLELAKILDLPVETTIIPLTNAEALERSVRSQGIAVFVVGRGLEKRQAMIKSVSTKAKVLTVGTSSAQARSGLSVAIYVKDGKSKILVNLSAIKAEGTHLRGDLVSLLDLIR
jgi:hypothetical protein